MRFPATLVAALFAATAFVVPAHAETTVTAQVFHKVIVVDSDGEETVSYEAVSKAIPGEHLVYRISLENTDPTPATSLSMAMDIDPNLVVDPSSFSATETASDFTVLFSADGSETFDAFEHLMITDAAGTRPATADDLTAMKIELSELAPKTTAVVEYGAFIR